VNKWKFYAWCGATVFFVGWQDLLDPKWKGGKLGMSTATHHLARLATLWGENKTTEFVKLLARQEPLLGEFGNLYSRMQLGEVLVIINDDG